MRSRLAAKTFANRRAVMKIPLLGCVAMACAATAFAQTSTSTSANPSPTNQTITLSGCVGPGPTANDPMMLSNVTIVPAGPTAPGAGTMGAAGTRGTAGGGG